MLLTHCFNARASVHLQDKAFDIPDLIQDFDTISLEIDLLIPCFNTGVLDAITCETRLLMLLF
jgi:hypothetical protein